MNYMDEAEGSNSDEDSSEESVGGDSESDSDNAEKNSSDEEESYEPLFSKFIHEAINSLNEEEVEKFEKNPLKAAKIVRKRLADVLVSKFSIKDFWKHDPDLQKLTESVKEYMEDEDEDEYLPAISYALQKRKIAIDKLIRNKISEICTENIDDEAKEL